MREKVKESESLVATAIEFIEVEAMKLKEELAIVSLLLSEAHEDLFE